MVKYLCMSNEYLFVISALLNIIFIFFAARQGKDWLLGTIIFNLILVGIFGAKLINVFGLVTNAGNVFYACVFLATHFILERHSEEDAWKTIWVGSAFMIAFILMSQMAVRLSGNHLTESVNNASSLLFSFSPRVVIASILSYIFAQNINIITYTWLKARTRDKFLWLRINGANILSQLVDSCLFFTIVFFDLSGPILVQTILAGLALKGLVVFIGTPFIYLDSYLGKIKK